MKNEFSLPSERLPAIVQLRIIKEINAKIIASAERQRRLLWMAVDAAGGRIEIDEAVYAQTLQAPTEDCYVATRPEMIYDVKLGRDVRKAILIFVDPEGKIDPRSEPKKIISTEL